MTETRTYRVEAPNGWRASHEARIVARNEGLRIRTVSRMAKVDEGFWSVTLVVDVPAATGR